MSVKISTRNLDFFYGPNQALYDISLDIEEKEVMAFIGPSGCGKSTFLRVLNRMNDTIAGTRVEGEVRIDDRNIYGSKTDVVELRKKVGMVFQKSNPFPKSIFDNVAYGVKINRMHSSKNDLEDRVEKALRDAALVSSGAFEGSADTQTSNRKDELMVYDNAAGGINKQPSATYYFDVSAGLWRSTTSDTADAGGTELSPGAFLVIRSASGGETTWTLPANP